jgi:hypothetical protein
MRRNLRRQQDQQIDNEFHGASSLEKLPIRSFVAIGLLVTPA